MTVINRDGALIGPGSEWFWAMAQFVVVTITLLAIYRQVRAEGSANALQQVDSFKAHWESDQMRRIRLQIALHLVRERDSRRSIRFSHRSFSSLRT
ncbi:MAG: hypothetical protein H0W81_02650 [Chloroflexi bacterium]|nr:hypothetical protein [Chloroflexota bacterium]